MTIRDPFELLAAINPVPTLSVSTPADEQLLQSILAGEITAPVSHRRRRRTWWIAGGAGVVGVALAAFALADRSSPNNPTQVSCYVEEAVHPSDQAVFPATDDPVAVCRDFWASGGFEGDGSVPPLAACINAGGVIVVIPGDLHVCERLGLQLWDGKFSDEQRQLVAMQRDFETLLDECLTDAQVATRAAELLHQYGHDDWPVSSNHHATEGFPCSAAILDLDFHRVTLTRIRESWVNDSSPATT